MSDHTRIYLDARNIQEKPTGVGNYALALIPEMVRQAPSSWEWVVIRHESNQLPILEGRPGFHEVFTDQRIGLLDDFLLGAGALHRVFRALGPPSVYHNLFHVSPLFLGHLGAYTPRRVVTLHDFIWADHAFEVKSELHRALFFKIYGSLAVSHTIYHADRVICVSEATRQRALRWVKDEDALITIPHGVEEVFFEDPPYPQRALGALGDARDREPYIVAVGNDKPYKNLARLVRAFAAARVKFGRGKLVLVGGCDGLRDLISKLGVAPHVILTGFLEDSQLRGVMGHARLFVFPSLVEGFGLPPLEAMALGVPCAVSDREPMRWVAGDGALRFDPLDIDELERVIIRMMTRDDLSEEYARRGRARARDFRWDRAASETLAVYESILSGE